MQKRKGFTTVELVIVIAVIAILATALIPTFGGLIKSANHNVDVQAANQLTTLVVMHSVNHPITSECDLADAINKGMNDPNYYANLQAKSAKYGYCFWYDYKDPQGARVRVGTVEEISAIATERVAQAFSIDDVRLGSAGSTSATHSFGLRADLIDGFVLMGYKGGNELMDLVCNLENAEDVGAYADAIAAIKAADSTNTAIANLQSKATSTVIHNEHGVFAPSSSVTSVHIPQGTDTLSNNRVVSDLTITDVTISIPSGTTVASGSLTYLGESCTVEINITAEELPNNIALQAITAEIKVSNGDRYTQDLDTVDANIFKLVGGTEDDNIKGVIDEETAKNLLNSYVLGDNSHEFVYIDIYTETNEAGYDGTIYISKDLADTNFSIVAENFLTANKESTTHGIFSWSVNGKKKADTGKTISINSAVTSVTVKTMGVEYTYAVKVAGVESIAINEIGGVKATRNVAFDAEHYSWKLTTQIALTDGIPLDSLTLDKTISIHSDSNGHFSINSAADGSATLSISSSLKNDSSNKVVFLCSGKQSDEMTINLIDTRNAAFKIKDDADTQSAYGFKYVVGTTGYAVTLGDLFEPKEGAVISGEILLSKDGTSTWGDPIPAADWSTIPLDLSGFTSDGTLTVYIKVAEGQYNDNSIPLVLDIKKDAYNVASLNDWKNAPNNTSIVLINSLTGDNAIPGGNYTTANADGYSKSIGAATIYGNLKTISVPDNFKIIYGAYNYFIQSAGGTIDHLVLVGPDYGSEVSVTGANNGSGDAETKGTHVSGIMAAGNINIYDSFISGFRSPLNVTVSGTITIKRTTLNRGNFANVNVEKASTFDLENVTTIQYEGKGGNIGAGFFFKYFAGENTIKATGLVQHNYVTETQIKSIAALFLNSMGKDVADALSGIFITGTDLTAMANAGITHTDSDGSTTLYHAGMFLQSQGSTKGRLDTTPTNVVGPTLNFSEINGGTYSSSDPIVKGIIFVKKSFGATIIGLDSDACGTTCSHARSAITGSSPADFLASKKVK
jgi:prepilin-type N-terminal cleavage/methylation domain-containing protein